MRGEPSGFARRAWKARPALHTQLLEARREGHARIEMVPAHERLVRRQRGDVSAGCSVLVARLELLPYFLRLLLDLLLLRHQQAQRACGRKEVEHRDRIRVAVESLAHGNNQQLIEDAGGSLRRRIESP